MDFSSRSAYIGYMGAGRPPGCHPVVKAQSGSIGAPATTTRWRSQVPGSLENLVKEIPTMSDANYADMTLAELFAEADKIGNWYQTDDEIASYRKQLEAAKSAAFSLIEKQERLERLAKEALDKYTLL